MLPRSACLTLGHFARRLRRLQRSATPPLSLHAAWLLHCSAAPMLSDSGVRSVQRSATSGYSVACLFPFLFPCLFCVLFVASVIAHRCSNFWCSAALVLGYFVALSTSGARPVQSSTALATWPLQRSAGSDPGRLDLSTLLALSNARPLQRLALVACPFAHCFAPTLCRSRDRFLRVFRSSAALVLARSGPRFFSSARPVRSVSLLLCCLCVCLLGHYPQVQ